jgi:hypothetical protein
VDAVFDRRPVLKFNSEGLWFKKGVSYFSKPCLIQWSSINYFYILEETRKTTVKYLMISQKEREREIKIELSGLSESENGILKVLRKYAASNNFKELDKIVRI